MKIYLLTHFSPPPLLSVARGKLIPQVIQWRRYLVMESWKDAKSTEGRKQQQVSFRDHHLGDLLYDYDHTLSKGIKYFISNI